MAITRAQQAKQLLKEGGRTGFFTAGLAAGDNISPGTSSKQGGDGPSRRDDGPSRSRIQNEKQQEFVKNQIKDLVDKQQEEKAFEPFETLMVKNNNFPGFIGMGLNALKGPRQKLLDRNIDFFRNDPRTARAREKYGLTAQGYKDYMSARLAGNIDAAGNIINQDDDDNSIIPFMAQAPSNMDQEPEEEEPFQRNFRLMADGGRAEFAEGGIMPRLSDLSGNVSSAEQMLQEINQRLQSAESSLGEGGAMQTSAIGSGPMQLAGGATQQPAFKSMEEAYSSFQDKAKETRTGGFLGQVVLPGEMNFKDFSNNMNLNTGFFGMHGAGGVPAGGNNMQSPLQTALGLADGGRAALAEGGMPYEGGIMDLESSRQMYGLGKLVKKVTRSVKKIAKSPIGKAALLYFGGNALAGGGLKSFLLGSNAGPNFSKTGLLQKMFLKNPSTGFSLGNLSGTAMVGIPAALSYFMTPEEEEQQAMNYGADIDDPKTIMNNPSLYTNRRLAAEGGSMDEPVAKKTMPLLDMDGQEMDLRAEGGFVPIGRMEKADDVPARLSKNEFVFTAEAVRNAGEGDVDKGAEVMYNMMKNLESGGDVSEESQGLEGAREMFQTSQRLEEVI